MAHRMSRRWAHLTAGLLAVVYGGMMAARLYNTRLYVVGSVVGRHTQALEQPRIQLLLLVTTLAVYGAAYWSIIGLTRLAHRWQAARKGLRSRSLSR